MLTWHRNKKTYILAQGRYWRYDHGAQQFDSDYPREVSLGWSGLPNYIDAAYSNGVTKQTFFISGDSFYKLNDQ